ncbi:MAG TPA: slipin family protein [Ktedonobacterales bacterium]|nr:slipin family protein [Ktedonobacterales bacterium]
MSTGAIIGLLVGGVGLLLLLFALAGLRVVYQYERGVIFVLGRLIGAKGPGMFWVPPLISRMRKVDLRLITVELPPQESVTRDNVTVRVSAVLFFSVADPSHVVNNVLDYYKATVQIAQTTLRSVLGQSLLDQVLSGREEIKRRVQITVDEHTEPWGLKVAAVEIKDVQLPPTMQRAMAKQAEAEREKRAKVLLAQGEYMAAQTLTDAAAILSTQPVALQLRYLQTLTEIAVEKTSTIVFPLPIELVTPLTALLRRAAGGEAAPGSSVLAAPVVVPADLAPALLSEQRNGQQPHAT